MDTTENKLNGIIKRLFRVLYIVTGGFVIIIFITHITVDNGVWFSTRHLFATGLASVPFIFLLLMEYVGKYIFFGKI